MTIYIAGPMTGLPDSNYPAFNAKAAELRAEGHTVLNPAENPPQDSWQAYMRLAIAQLVQADQVVMLPGWSDSEGASLEFMIARRLKIDVVGCI